ncbi:MAG: DMT family transporter [Candidatus Omnitrophica bacterium]|nr:DMT family transporter [Candidatus Omnitrophota bacterium]
MNPKPKKFDLIGSLALAGSILCWSLIPAMLKYLEPYITGWESNAVRYPFASMLWAGPLYYFWRKGRVPRSVWKWALLPAGVNVFAQGLWAWLPYFNDASVIGFLARTSVVFAITGGLILFPDERPIMKSPMFWIGVVLCAGGFLIMNAVGANLSSGDSLFGPMLVLICGMFYGLYGVSVRYSMHGVRPWIAFPVISIYTSIVLLGFLFVFEPDSHIIEVAITDTGPFLVLLLSAFIGIASAHTFFYISLERLGSAISGGMQLVGAFITPLWAYLFLGEKLTWLQWQGGIVLLLGGALLLSAQTKIHPKSMDEDEVTIEPRIPD